MRYSALVLQVAGIQRSSWLKQHEVSLLFCIRHVLYAMRNNDELTWLDGFIALFAVRVAQLDVQLTFYDHEHLVFRVMVVPHELTLDFDQLDLKIVKLANDPGIVVVIECGKFPG